MLTVNRRFESEDEPSNLPLNVTPREQQLWLQGYRMVAEKYSKEYICGWRSQYAKFGKMLQIRTYWKGHGKYRMTATIVNIVNDMRDGIGASQVR